MHQTVAVYSVAVCVLVSTSPQIGEDIGLKTQGRLVLTCIESLGTFVHGYHLHHPKNHRCFQSLTKTIKVKLDWPDDQMKSVEQKFIAACKPIQIIPLKVLACRKPAMDKKHCQRHNGPRVLSP